MSLVHHKLYNITIWNAYACEYHTIYHTIKICILITVYTYTHAYIQWSIKVAFPTMPWIHSSALSPYLANQWLRPPIWMWSRSGRGVSHQTHTLGPAWVLWLPCWAGPSLWTTAWPTQTPKTLHSESQTAHLGKNPLYHSWREEERRDKTDA